MTIELMQSLSLASFIAAGVVFAVGIALFFLLDVPKLYGDISGRTAKKAIEAIRRKNEETGNKAYRPSTVNAERGKLTDKITPSGRVQSHSSGLQLNVGTEKLDTALLTPQSGETTVLDGPAYQSAETTVLSGEEGVGRNNAFGVDVEISFSESTEVIE